MAPDLDLDDGEAAKGSPSRTLVRGLEILNAVSCGHTELGDLAETLGLTRTTIHRLASTLIDHRLLVFTPRAGYALGPKLLELGFIASRQMSVTKVARAHLEALCDLSGDTVHLGVLDRGKVLYLDKIPGSRRLDVSSRIGDRQPLRSTGLGKALLLDEPEIRLQEIFRAEKREGLAYPVSASEWLRRMSDYRTTGVAFDLEENPDRVRCVAAPIRGVDGKIVAALSLTSASQYLDDARMALLSRDVLATAHAVSQELGWRIPSDGIVAPSATITRAQRRAAPHA
jgi:DNA-binding IclR family transcriptional regulator